jgi:hypothetical protein
VASTIQKKFDESVDNPRHFEKVQWFARYWNESVDHQELFIYGSGLSTVRPAGQSEPIHAVQSWLHHY